MKLNLTLSSIAICILMLASCSSDASSENTSKLLTYRIRTSVPYAPSIFYLREGNGLVNDYIVHDGSETPAGWDQQFIIHPPFEAYIKVINTNTWYEEGVAYTYDILVDDVVVGTKNGVVEFMGYEADSLKCSIQ